MLSFQETSHLDAYIRKPRYLQELRTFAGKAKVPIVSDQVGQFLQLVVSLKACRRILEIGAGTGYASFWMLQANDYLQVTALDSNPQRIHLLSQFV